MLNATFNLSYAGYRRERLAVNLLAYAVLGVWAVGLALHLLMFVTQGSFF